MQNGDDFMSTARSEIWLSAVPVISALLPKKATQNRHKMANHSLYNLVAFFGDKKDLKIEMPETVPAQPGGWGNNRQRERLTRFGEWRSKAWNGT